MTLDTVRWANPADTSAIEALETACFDPQADPEAVARVSPIAEDHKLGMLKGTNGLMATKWHDGRLVARLGLLFCSLAGEVGERFTCTDPRAAKHGDECIFFRSAIVDRSYRGKGAGKDLFKFAIAELSGNGLPMAFISTPDNTPIMNIVETFGFTDTIPVRREVDGKDMVLYIRPASAQDQLAVA